MTIKAYAFCVMCREGLVLSSSTGRVENCPICHGSTVVTPENICYCGKSCLLEKAGHSYCGNEECYKGLIRDANWTPFSGFGQYGGHRDW